jgi:hypothetical protein
MIRYSIIYCTITGDCMSRKHLPILFIAVLLLSFAISPIQANPSGIIGLRIMADEASKLSNLDQFDGKLIDYGSFIWLIPTPGDLTLLRNTGISYQLVDDAYRLSLGGQSADPLVSELIFVENAKEKLTTLEEGLHLVQFYGPTKTEWLETLENNGVSIIQYIHPFTYVVWGELTVMKDVTHQAPVRWSGAFASSYALQSQFITRDNEPIKVRAMSIPQAGLDSILQSIVDLGGQNIAVNSTADPVFDLITFLIPGGQMESIAALPGIYAVQPVSTSGGDRGELSSQVNVNNYDGVNRAFTGYTAWLDAVDLSGHNVIVANVDSGIAQSHPDLINRLLPCTGTSCNDGSESSHGTHTAGIIAGDASSAVTDGQGFLRGLGMAPGASLIDQLYNPTYAEPNGVLTLMAESVRNGAVISGNSWGPSDTALGYDMDTRLVDIGVRDADPLQEGNQPVSYILSIMNGSGGASSQGTPDEAKNILSVGSTYLQNSNGTQRLDIDNISPNSAHGPALDGRNIPLLVAPGYSVDSTVTDAGYMLMGGTSMASPQVTGAVALFYERYRNLYGVDPSPALVKAAFLPVAHDLAGNLDADGNLLGHPFDSKQGWGRLNAEVVLDPSMTVLYFDQGMRFDATGETFTMNMAENRTIRELRAMLVWTDAPGHGLGGSDPAWVNDLDLSITINGQTFWGNNFGADGFSIPGSKADEMHNTEGIFLSELPSSNFVIKVIAANINSDGVPNVGDDTDQDFALVVYIDYEVFDGNYQIFIPLISH